MLKFAAIFFNPIGYKCKFRYVQNYLRCISWYNPYLPIPLNRNLRYVAIFVSELINIIFFIYLFFLTSLINTATTIFSISDPCKCKFFKLIDNIIYKNMYIIFLTLQCAPENSYHFFSPITWCHLPFPYPDSHFF